MENQIIDNLQRTESEKDMKKAETELPEELEDQQPTVKTNEKANEKKRLNGLRETLNGTMASFHLSKARNEKTKNQTAWKFYQAAKANIVLQVNGKTALLGPKIMKKFR